MVDKVYKWSHWLRNHHHNDADFKLKRFKDNLELFF